ncbi:SigE family RNA polymerase sigma factor [Nocardioides sp. P5_C9_2]
MQTEPSGFREFVVARSPALLRTAWMLTGDQAAAEDLLQTALARTWPHWARIADGHPDAYVRKVMVRVNANWRARRWNQETPTPDGDLHHQRHDASDANDPARHDDRLILLKALMTLPVRQRHVVVLRFFDDLSVDAVADVMGCSTGTVKSQSAKGLAKLRQALEATEPDRTSTR